MSLTELQKAGLRNHLHSSNSVIDPATGLPITSELGGAASTGGTPAVVLGTAAAAGISTHFLRDDDTIVAFDATAPSTQAYGDAASVGTAAKAARRDHKHAMPAATALDPANLAHIASPSTPAAGHTDVYAKSDGRVYSKGPDGVEHGPFDAAGGGLVAATIVPLDIDRPDRYPLHASGSEFAGTDMSGWSFQGNTPTIVYQQSDLYCDASATKFTPAGSNVYAYYKAAPAGDFEIILSVYGRSANSGMFGPMIVDSTGAGLAFSPYTDGSCYTWNLVGWVYASSGSGLAGIVPYSANVSTSGLNHYCLSLKRVGTDYTIRYSVDGGRTWSASYTRTSVSFTVAYIGFGEFFTGSYSIYVDRFNVYEPAWAQYT